MARKAGRLAGWPDLLFPPACESCGELVEENTNLRTLCPDCRQRIHLVCRPHCPTCGYPFFGEVEEGRLCPHCVELSPRFGEGKTLALLHGPLRPLLLALKYRAGFHVLGALEDLARRHPELPDFLAGAILVPVPLHARKERERGFNQAVLLAGIVSRVGGGRPVLPLLERTRDTPTQTRLDRRQRQRNLKNAFAIRKGVRFDPTLRHVLVDDVFTTGSTLNACATVLRRAGLKHVDVLTFGHG
ncbi:MAG: ComF family protein [Puniceicoccaceae bacterium]|nr:MAG: ComF family protein [Puniceicoccaceae bacterium]